MFDSFYEFENMASESVHIVLKFSSVYKVTYVGYSVTIASFL